MRRAVLVVVVLTILSVLAGIYIILNSLTTSETTPEKSTAYQQSPKTHKNLLTMCENAMKECAYEKGYLANSGDDYTVCALICKPCYELDRYLNQTEGAPSANVEWSKIEKYYKNNSWMHTYVIPETNYYKCVSYSPFE